MNPGDKKLDGVQSASFSCLFGKEQSAAIKALAKDTMATVTGKISKGSGVVELNDCKIVKKLSGTSIKAQPAAAGPLYPN